MIDIDAGHFEELVAHAYDQIPDEFGALVRNVAIVIEDEAPGQPGLLGLYRGVPLTQRQAAHAGFLPDSITIYRQPILRICQSYEDVVRQVRVTLVHEIGHFLGIDEQRLHDLGYG